MGGNHGRLRHLGWEGSGQGLTSRTWETSSRAMLDELLSLLGYPLHSGDALLGGFLLLRHCKRFFLGGSLPMVRLVGLSWEVLVNVWLWQTVGVRLRQLVAWVEELEVAGWKELEFVGREHCLPAKLRALGFLRGLSAPRLFQVGGRLSTSSLCFSERRCLSRLPFQPQV